MTPPADPQARDRLGPWIEALRHRLDRVRPVEAAASGRMLVEQLAALASDDIDAVRASVTPDVVVNVWGVVAGGHRSWQGPLARDALTALLAAAPAEVMSARVDIDRFFPGGDVIGFDGDLSWLRIDAATTNLVQRRLGVFATYREGMLAELDLYVDVHEAVDVNDRAGQ